MKGLCRGGQVLRHLSARGAAAVARAVRDAGAESAAVCLLFSFEYPQHEQAIGRELEKLGIPVSLSSQVLPEYREYERASTTVMNAYVSPVMDGYLARLEEGLAPGQTMRLMHSAGGTVSPAAARSRSVDLVLSGPAGGVVAAGRLAGILGIDRVMSFDMGGTSTDVSVLEGGPTVTRSTRISGLPLALPMIDIHTIGAGGGSIVHLDPAGVLKVGPRSAGADPGPACYGKGVNATVTDANLALGRMEPSWFLGGRMALDPSRSLHALRRAGGSRGALETARAALEVALSHMEKALKTVSVERGHDPRDFTLFAFGGAGPMHACELAERLEMSRVVVPPYPGLFSSLGMLLAEPGRDYSRTMIGPLEPTFMPILEQAFEQLEQGALLEMSREGFESSHLKLNRMLALRYHGQSHEVTVAPSRLEHQHILGLFESTYHREFGYQRTGQAVEVVHLHLNCRAAAGPPVFEAPATQGPPPSELPRERLVHFGSAVPAGLFHRSDIDASREISGPALVLQEDSTVVVPPRWQATGHRSGSLLLERRG